jgi:hypothetical protein
MSFTFNASAVGLGGVIVRGGATTFIPSIASVALAPTGGEGVSTVTDYEAHGITIGLAQTVVRGTTVAGKHRTTTHVMMNNVSVFGRLHIGSLDTKLVSTHDGRPDDEPEFEITAEMYGVSLDGESVLPTIDTDFLNTNRRYLPLANHLISGANNLHDRVDFTPGAGRAATVEDALRRDRDERLPIRCSMLEEAIIDASGRNRRSTSRGLRLRVNRFGTLHLGEVIFKPGRRRVNFLRLELDNTATNAGHPNFFAPAEQDEELIRESPDGGSLTIASIEGNGSPSWP